MEATDPPLFSICLILWDFSYMAHWSFQSIMEQTCPSYEIIVVEKTPTEALHQMAETGQKPVTFLECKESAVIGDLLNQALSHAKGKYIHIMQPGDTYLSKLGLSYVAEIIRENPDCDLVYCAYLLKEGKNFPVAISQPLSHKLLQKGKMPTRLHSCWFSRKIFEEIGSFNTHFLRRPGLDFLCRIFLKKGYKFYVSRRVIVDYEPFKVSTGDVFSYTLETFRIIYLYFGLYRAISWWFLEEHLGFFRWGLRSLKKIFWKS